MDPTRNAHATSFNGGITLSEEHDKENYSTWLLIFRVVEIKVGFIEEAVSLIKKIKVSNSTTRQKGILHKFRGESELEGNF
jgi:hypothetical protein